MIESILLTGKKPPDAIIVIDKLKASKVRIFIKFKTINKIKVNEL
tara:strand:+ start:245 stop:379 length:135 start_codon:yes stop_codon:yes gene_type:complete